MVVIGAFVAGAAIGVAGDRAMRPSMLPGGPVDSRTFWNRTAADWGLSPAQRKVVDSLMDVQHRKMAALYRPLRPTMDSVDAIARKISDSTQDQLRLILTPEQQTKLDELRAEMRKRDSTRRAHRMQR